MVKLEFKHLFVFASIFGSILVGSINSCFRVWGFLLCVIGNVYWIYHTYTEKDKEMLIVFAAYFIINALAVVNNYYNGLLVW
jgi:hypothetical protein